GWTSGTTPATASSKTSLAWTTSRWQKRPTEQPCHGGQRRASRGGRARAWCMIPGNAPPSPPPPSPPPPSPPPKSAVPTGQAFHPVATAQNRDGSCACKRNVERRRGLLLRFLFGFVIFFAFYRGGDCWYLAGWDH